MKRRMWAIALPYGALLLGSAAADVWVAPRPLPRAASAARPMPQKKGFAQVDLEALLRRVAPTLPTDVRQKLSKAVLVESARAGYDPLFVLALVSVESRFRLAVSSERGARGLVQLMPSTFAWISAREPDIGGEDYATGEDPVIDVRLAVRYCRWLERRFRNRDDALMAYNAGPRRLTQYKEAEEIPERLRDYPRRVKREHERLVRLLDGNRDSGQVLLARAG